MSDIDVIVDLLRKQEEQRDLQLAEVRALAAKVDAARAEGTARGTEQTNFNERIDREVRGVRHELKNALQRVGAVEEQYGYLANNVSQLDKKVGETILPLPNPPRSPSSHDLEVEAELDGVIAKTITLDQGVRTVMERLDHQDKESKDRKQVQERINHALCATMGINYAAVAASPEIGNGIQTKALTAPKTNLPRVAAENRVAAIMAFLAFATALFQWLSSSHH